MCICNFMLLTEISPKEAYKWFISFVSIDAYEWVMEPNVFGMGLHSVGKLMMNRPYFSSSNYIKKMSDFTSSSGQKIVLNGAEYSWDEIFDALFYNFVNNNKAYLSKIYSSAIFVKILKNKKKADIDKYLNISKQYLETYL